MEMMIEVQDLTKYYGPTLAISRLNFQVGAGEIVGFLGPNAAGKTTTLKILAGFLVPSSGIARINGRDCLSESLEARRSLGYLPETVPLYTDLTVSQFLRFAAQPKECHPNRKSILRSGPPPARRSKRGNWRARPGSQSERRARGQL